MAKVLFKRIENSDYIDNVTVEDGSFIITGDGKCYIDYGNTRVEMNTTSNTPIGTILPYGGITIPEGWLLCDGSTVSRTTYSNLYLAIRETYGSGDGSTTFNLPNLKGKIPVGLDSNDNDFNNLGKTGGSKELQAHSHKTTTDIYAKALSTSTTDAESFSAAGNANYRRTTTLSNNNTGTAGTGNSGNLQPYIVMNYIIKY